MQARTVLNHLFWLLLPPLLIQQLSKSVVCSGMIQQTPAMVVKKAHISVVILQCSKKCLLVSIASLHKRYLEATLIPLFCNASSVKHAFLATCSFIQTPLLCPANSENSILAVLPNEVVWFQINTQEFSYQIQKFLIPNRFRAF